MRILFCIVIAIPKGMSGKYFLKVSSISDIVIMSKLQIETLKFVYSSCCFTIPELVLSDQLIAGTHNFRTNFFRPTKFRTNKFPDQLFFGFLTILTEKQWSDYRCFTVDFKGKIRRWVAWFLNTIVYCNYKSHDWLVCKF